MLNVEMRGRLGNQLFVYAFARKLQLTYNEEINFSFSSVLNRNDSKNGWEDQLKHFNVAPYKVSNKSNELIKSQTNLIQKITFSIFYITYKKYKHDFNKLFEIQAKYQKWINKFGIYWLSRGYFDFKFSKSKNKIFCGSFESSKYFNDIRPYLLNEFTPVNKRLEKNKALYEIIENSESVCISIRRGDFTTSENAGLRDVCSKEYYTKAIDKMYAMLPNSTFIVFSDDIDWVKKNMNFKGTVYYEEGDDPVWEKLRLMYSCKHFILANSTFSWWAQYLSRNDKKIVISPSKWFATEYVSPLIEDDWVLVEV